MLTIEQFAKTTAKAIEEQPLHMFQPTLLDFDTNKARVLSGVPSDVAMADAMRGWIAQLGVKRFAAAFRCDDGVGIVFDDGTVRKFARLSAADGFTKLQVCGSLLD